MSRSFNKDGKSWVIPQAFYRVSTKYIILNDQSDLLVLQDPKNGLWELPGGGIDHGESMHDAGLRELQEELGVDSASVVTDPLFVVEGEHPDGYPTIKVYYRAFVDSSAEFVLEDGFVSRWVSKNEFLSVEMPGDEAGVKVYFDRIWG